MDEKKLGTLHLPHGSPTPRGVLGVRRQKFRPGEQHARGPLRDLRAGDLEARRNERLRRNGWRLRNRGVTALKRYRRDLWRISCLQGLRTTWISTSLVVQRKGTAPSTTELREGTQFSSGRSGPSHQSSMVLRGRSSCERSGLGIFWCFSRQKTTFGHRIDLYGGWALESSLWSCTDAPPRFARL